MASAGEKRTSPQPCAGIKHEAVIPGAIGLDAFQRFLQPHARRRQEAGRGLNHRQCVELYLKPALVGQFGSARRAARNVLLQLMPCVVRQFVVQIQRDVFLHPLAIHGHYLCFTCLTS